MNTKHTYSIFRLFSKSTAQGLELQHVESLCCQELCVFLFFYFYLVFSYCGIGYTMITSSTTVSNNIKCPQCCDLWPCQRWTVTACIHCFRVTAGMTGGLKLYSRGRRESPEKRSKPDFPSAFQCFCPFDHTQRHHIIKSRCTFWLKSKVSQYELRHDELTLITLIRA